MSRTDILELIQRDLDGDLSPVEQAILQQKLAVDPELQLIHARLSHVSHQLEHLPPVAPPFSLVDAILPQLEHSSPDPVQPEAKPQVVQLPRLEKKSGVTVEKTKRTVPTWLLKVSSGVVAASLLFGIYAVAHHAKPTEGTDYTNGSPIAEQQQPATVQPVPMRENPSPPPTGTAKEETPGTNETEQGDQQSQQTVVEKNQSINPSPYQSPAKKQAVAKKEDNSKDQNHGKKKSANTSNATSPLEQKKAAVTKNSEDQATKKATDKNQKSNQEKSNGKEPPGQAKDKNKDTKNKNEQENEKNNGNKSELD